MDASKSAKLYQTKAASVQLRYGLQLLNFVTIEPGYKVGDIGCGCGNLSAEISRLVGETGKIIAIDPDTNRIKTARREYGQLSNITFLPLKSIHFPTCNEEPYDVFVSNAVLHWIPTDEKEITFQRMMKSLKPGGIFVGNISFTRSTNMKVATSMLSKEQQEEIEGFYYRENPEILQGLLEDAGFEILEFNYRYTEINMGTIAKFLDWISSTYYGKFDFKMAYKKNKHLVKFECFENGDVKHVSEGALFVVKKPDVIT